MQIKWKKLLIKLSVWIVTETLLNFLGLDNLADYSEFVFEQVLTNQSKVTTQTGGLIMITPIDKNPRFRKEKSNAKVASLLPFTKKSQQSYGKQKTSAKKLVELRSLQGKFSIYTGEKLHWLQVSLRLAKTVLHGIFPWILVCGGYGFLISVLNYYGIVPSSLSDNKVIPSVVLCLNIVLSLLLIFRTNTAHERFWEGRKLWGSMVNVVRNLARGIWIIVEEKDHRDRTDKEAAMRLVVAFAVAMKIHLRRDPMNEELEPLMSSQQYQQILAVNHGPLEVAFWLGDYLQHQYDRKQLNVFQLTALHEMLDEMVDILGGCERILKTPVPLVYTITLSILLVVYFAVLPLQIVGGLTWWTGPILAVVSLLFLAINEVGAEIEEPFGHDPNDLPLDFICNTINRNIEDLIQQAPHSRHIVDWHRKAA
jgi:ion channel-forming bestrophin family protein